MNSNEFHKLPNIAELAMYCHQTIELKIKASNHNIIFKTIIIVIPGVKCSNWPKVCLQKLCSSSMTMGSSWTSKCLNHRNYMRIMMIMTTGLTQWISLWLWDHSNHENGEFEDKDDYVHTHDTRQEKPKISGTIDLSFTRSRSELFYLRAPQ